MTVHSPHGPLLPLTAYTACCGPVLGKVARVNTFRKLLVISRSLIPSREYPLCQMQEERDGRKLGPQIIPLSFTPGLQGVLSRLLVKSGLWVEVRRLISEGKSSMIFKWHHST